MRARFLAAAGALAAALLPPAVASQVPPAPPETSAQTAAPAASGPAVETAVTPLAGQRDPLPGVRTGGAPQAPGGLAELAADGFRTYVDLRTPAERTPEFRAAVEAAGLELVELPVAGEGDLDLASARALDALLDDPARRPMVIACASGNRVGALLAVREFWLEGAEPEAALALGKAAGLTKLEPSVRVLLGLPPADPGPPPSAPPS